MHGRVGVLPPRAAASLGGVPKQVLQGRRVGKSIGAVFLPSPQAFEKGVYLFIYACVGVGVSITLHPSRETKFSDANGDRETFSLRVQLTTSRVGDLTRLICTLLYVMTIDT